MPAYQNRGNAWYARGNYGEALEDYDTAIRLDPNAASAYVNRATVRRDLGVIDGALEDYQKAIELGAQAPAYAAAANSTCAGRTMPRPSPTSNAPCG